VPVRRERLARNRAKVSQRIAAEIVREIVENDLQEGDRLATEAAMLEEFDGGRASVREGCA
jgi:DNA-binding FadR family transcriptional regulator